MAKKTTKKTTKKTAKKPATAKKRTAKKPSPKRSETTKQITPDMVNYAIRAGAGCGKSTTLEWSEYGVPDSITPSSQQSDIFAALGYNKQQRAGRSLRVACFNNSIMEELEPKFPGCDVRNNNKIGFHALKKFLNVKGGYSYVKAQKYSWIAKDIIGNPWDDTKLWPEFSAALKLCTMARVTLTGKPLRNTTFASDTAETDALWEVSQDELIKMADFYGIDIEDGSCLKHVESLINAGISSCRTMVDFADQIFLPNVFDARPPKVSRLYIDEMQDLNAAQHGLLYGTAEQYVVVGDVFQSIYGFAGADPDSMPRFEKMVDATLLPLTVTRRCPHSHVEQAKRYLPPEFAELFQAAPDAPDGEVISQGFGIDFYRSMEGTSNLIMSRTNAPMVRNCFTCWKNDIPALIRGRDVGANLVQVIKGSKCDDNKSLIIHLNDTYQEKIEKLNAGGKDDLALAKQDELEILVTFAEETRTIDDCISKMFAMFDDKKRKARAVQFATVHKAKGLEADNIGILTPELMPHVGISKLGPFWARQEKNVHYVCHTRGMGKMFINDGPLPAPIVDEEELADGTRQPGHCLIMSEPIHMDSIPNGNIPHESLINKISYLLASCKMMVTINEDRTIRFHIMCPITGLGGASYFVIALDRDKEFCKIRSAEEIWLDLYRDCDEIREELI